MGMLKLLSVQHGNHSTFLTHHRKRIAVLFGLLCFCMAGLTGRLVFLMLYRADHYSEMAEELHQRERSIKAARGRILDRNGTVIAANRTVCTISVIHNQIKNPETVIQSLCEILGTEEDSVRKKVEKRSSREIIRTNVDKETGDRIRELHLAGVKVDEDYRRSYPFDSLASKVLGFTGGDNQGIIGLEAAYESILKGKNGTILTMTDAAGVELENAFEERIEPVAGADLYLSLDVNIQQYAEQAALTVMEQKSAKRVSVIVMDPQNGEILAMVNVPEFNLNDPFTLNTEETAVLSAKEKQKRLNQMWRNPSINDTYEPGSTFKIITAAAGLEAGAVALTDRFSCPGFRVVEDRKIRCHKVGGHGEETFLQGAMNSCNPVFIDVGQRLGIDRYCQYFEQFGLREKTGIDLPGEASTIMHKQENMGLVELATCLLWPVLSDYAHSAGRRRSASIVNGGSADHTSFWREGSRRSGWKAFSIGCSYPEGKQDPFGRRPAKPCDSVLEKVVSEGGGKKAYSVRAAASVARRPPLRPCPGGRTSTFPPSSALPRRIILQVLAMCIIHNPQGVYYGGTIAAPVISRCLYEYSSLSWHR